MSLAEKIQRGILVALETPGYWRDFSDAFRLYSEYPLLHGSKYHPHQGRQECARRLKRIQKTGS